MAATALIPERFTADPDALQRCGELLYPAWMDYVQNVSPANMAMSLNSCRYILWLARQLAPASAADFGSGLTSYTLRYACPTVYSIDDSAEWLAKTKTFLHRYDLNDEHIYLFDDYTPRQHDLIVYDFAGGDTREAHMRGALDQLAPGGVAVLDDAQHDGHRACMEASAAECGCDLWMLADVTGDRFNRYAALAVKR